MKTFKPLIQPDLLPDAFDAAIFGEEPIVEIHQEPGLINITYTFPGFFVSDDAREVDGDEIPFTQLNIAAAGFLAESGKPLLPSFGRYVQIPPNHNYTLAVEKSGPVFFEDVLVLPAQERLTDSPDQEVAFEYDTDFYAGDLVYPAEMVQVQGPLFFDGYTALLLHVVPFQYNPAQRQLIGYGKVSVTIQLEPVADSDAPPTIYDADENLEAFGNLMLNPSRSVVEHLALETPLVPGMVTLFRGPEYLIIYHPGFVRAAQLLADWKNRRGLRTQIVSIDVVGNSVPQIKDYIRTRRQGLSQLRYVLLLGDVDMITSELVAGGPWGDNVTDYYYATPRDAANWQDLVMPWLAIGRIPVRTATEALAVARQIVKYEKQPPTAAAYYKQMVFAAYFQDNNFDGKADRAYLQTMEGIRKHMVAQGYNVDRVYVKTPGAPAPQFYIDGTPVPPDVVAAFVDPATATNRLVTASNQGKLVAGHRDHGDIDGWSHPSFKLPDLSGITSGIPTVFFSVNCLTGQFDLVAPTESFAEKMLRISGGAPSLIAATRVSHTWLNNDLIKALFDATWGGVLSTFPGTTASYPVRHNRLGDILNYAKYYLPISMSGSVDYVKDHFEIYHVVGDPTLELWRESPRRITLKSWFEKRYLHIQLNSVVKEGVLTIWYGDRLLRRLQPSATYVKLALPLEEILETPEGEPLKLRVCFWAPGYRIREVQPKLVVAPDALRVMDAPAGTVAKTNGDGNGHRVEKKKLQKLAGL